MDQEEANTTVEEPVHNITADDLAADYAKHEAAAQEATEETPLEQPAQESETPSAPSWEDEPLPDGHPYAEKYKTRKAFLDAYEASGTEARRLYEDNQYLNQVVKGIDVLNKRQAEEQAKQPAQTATTQQGTYMGFASKEAFGHAMAADADATMSKAFKYTVQNNPDLLKTFVDEAVKEKMAPIEEERQRAEEQRYIENLDKQLAEVQEEYPDLKDKDSALGKAVAHFAGSEEGAWLSQLHDLGLKNGIKIPNPARIAVQLANYPIMQQQLKAFEAKLGDKQKNADTSRPGQTVAGKPKTDGTPQGMIDHAIADYVQQHGKAPPKAWVDAAKRGFANLRYD